MNWQELKDEKLEDLVEFVQLQKGDAEAVSWSQAAFLNITFRYRKDVLEKCTIMCRKNSLTDTDAEEIATRVFERFYKYPSFNSAKCRVTDIDKCFRLYLYAIARNEFIDYVKPDESPYVGDEHVITSLVDANEEYEPDTLKILQEKDKELDSLFSQLSPKHKIIYLTYLYHGQEGKYLPERLCAELRTVLNISQNSIRVYKKQAFDLAKSKGYGI